MLLKQSKPVCSYGEENTSLEPLDAVSHNGQYYDLFLS